MNGICPTGPTSANTALNPYSGAKIDQSTLNLQNTQQNANAQFEIVTQEGDTVTISAQSNTQSALANYDANGQLDGSTFSLSAQASQYVTSRDISLSIDGQLNEQELQDIRDLLNSIGDSIEGLIQNGADDSQNTTLLDSLSRPDTISSLNVSIDVSAAQSNQVSTYTRSGADQATGRTDRSDGKNHRRRRHMGSLLKRLDMLVQRFGDRPDKLAEKLPKLMARLLQKFGHRHGAGSPQFAMAKQIIEQLNARIDGSNLDGSQTAPPQDANIQSLAHDADGDMDFDTDAANDVDANDAASASTSGSDSPTTSIATARALVNPASIPDSPPAVDAASNDTNVVTDAATLDVQQAFQAELQRVLSIDLTYSAPSSYQLYQPALQLLV